MLTLAVMIANVVWPALWLEARLLSWWIILFGLAVELPFVRFLTGFSWQRASIADLAMNAASTIVGIVLIPISGIAWEYAADFTVYRYWKVGTFNPVAWAATFLLAVALNAIIEQSVLRWGFRQWMGARGFAWLSVANALSVGLALWSIFHNPPRP
jgi:hypothetical protein